MIPKRRNPITNSYQENRFNKISIPKKDYMSTIIGWAVFVYFLSAIIIMTNHDYFVLSVFQFIQLFCLLLALTFLVPIKFYRKKLDMSYYEYIFLNFLGFSPILLLLVLGVNYSFKSAPYEETYRIVNYTSSQGNMTYVLEGNKYEDYDHIRTIKLSGDVEIEGNTFMSISFSNGLLGIRMIEKQKIH